MQRPYPYDERVKALTTRVPRIMEFFLKRVPDAMPRTHMVTVLRFLSSDRASAALEGPAGTYLGTEDIDRILPELPLATQIAVLRGRFGEALGLNRDEREELVRELRSHVQTNGHIRPSELMQKLQSAA